VLALWRKIAATGVFIHFSHFQGLGRRRARTRFASAAALVGAAAAFFAAVCAPPCAQAQAVSSLGDEARTIPGGDIRISVSESDTRFNQRYGPGGLLPLGADLSVDSLNVAQLPILGASQTALQSLLGDPTYRLTLGNTVVGSAVRMSSTPITLEVGLTHWLTLRATAPIVRTHDEVFFNPNAQRIGNVGLNPALFTHTGARVTDSTLLAQFSTAGSTLQADLAACEANPASAAYCPSLDAQAAAATALIQQSGSFAAAMARVYGGGGSSAALVVPVINSAAQNAVSARVTSFASTYAHFDSLTGGPGITGPGPAPAAPLAYSDGQTLLTSPAFGLEADSLRSIDRTSIGDVDLSATLQLFDSFHGSDSARLHPRGFNVRTAVTGLFRLGSGLPKSPEDYIGIGAATGTGVNAVEVHSATDILFGRHLWASIIAIGTQPMTDQISARIPLSALNVYIPKFAEQMVGRSLGRSLSVEVDPHYSFNDYVGLTANYSYRRKETDRYTGRFAFDSAETGFGPTTLDASILDGGTDWTEHRIGLGLTLSTVAAAARGKSIPFEVSFFHYQTLTGSGTELPRLNYDEVQVRMYVRLWGHKQRAGNPSP